MDDHETAAHRIAWELWQTTGLTLEQLRARFPHLPWHTLQG